MKYENGSRVLPERLFKQVQKFAAGRLIYIPADSEKKPWGKASGYKQYLSERNGIMKKEFAEGKSIDELSRKYSLSVDTVKRIVYSKNAMIIRYKGTLTSAVEYSKAGRLEEWIHAYLLSDGHNKEFSDGLKIVERYYIAPVKMPLSLFARWCGPEEGMKCKLDGTCFEIRVNGICEAIRSKADLPPLIVNYDMGTFELNDGNHRFEAYKRMEISEAYVIIWITGKESRNDYINRFGEYT